MWLTGLVCMSVQDGSIPLLLAADAGNVAVCKELLQHYSEQQTRAQKQVTNETPFDGHQRVNELMNGNDVD